jgi:type IV secretory pathway TrbD component
MKILSGIMGAGREIHLFHGVFKVAFVLGIELAVIAELVLSLLFFWDALSGFR